MAHHADPKKTKEPVKPDGSRWFLLQAGLAPSTRKKYKDAVTKFMSWCTERKEVADTYEELDELIADYLHEHYEAHEGRGKQFAKDTLNGVHNFLPRSKGQLLISSKVVQHWNKAHPAESYPPITWELAVTVAIQMVRGGDYLYGVATVVSFDCLLRVSELMALRREDVSFAGDARVGSAYRKTLIAIRKAKTGNNQSVDVHDSKVADLLRSVVSRTKPGQLLFPGGPRKYRKCFKSTCAELGLSQLYVPHSLRHGGATLMYLQGQSVEHILLRGRWASTKSARTYVKSGPALALAVKVPKRIGDIAAVLASDLTESFTLAQKH